MHFLNAIQSRLAALFRKRALESDMEAEMRAHIDQRTQQNMEAGMPPQAAREAALRQFGWIESIKEDCRDQRGVRWLENLGQDLRFGARQLAKNPGFTIVAVLTLALGIGANTALFSVINAVLLRPLPFHEQERLVTLWESSPARAIEQQAVSPPNFAEWREQASAIGEMAFWTGPSDFNLVTGDGVTRVRASYSSSSLLEVLRVQPQIGHGFLAEADRKEGPKVALISDRLWRNQFEADREVVGKTLTVDTFGRRTYTIVGVLPPGFQFPEDTELWLAAGWNGLPRDRRSGHWLNVLARLRPGVTLSQTRAELNVIQARIAQENAGIRLGSEVSVVPLLEQTVGRSTRTALVVMWGVVAGVLLIACANVANLMLARAAARQKEIAVRLALGAGRWRVVRQLLTESVLLAVLSGAVGVLFGYWGVKAFVAASPANIPRLEEVSVDGMAMCFTLVAAILTGLVFGLAPAWQSSRPDLNGALKESTSSASLGIAHGRLRSALIIAEMALSTLLLIGAGLMLQSFARLQATDRGIHPEHVVTAELDFSVAGFTTWVRPTATRPQVQLQALLEQLRQLPGVQSAGAAYRFLRRDNRPPGQSFTIFGKPAVSESERPVAENNAVTPGYLRTLGIRLLRGRDFTETDTLEAPGVALVNESFVRRFFPNEEPLGKFITTVATPGPLDAKDAYGVAVWCQIVGIVSDVKSLSAQPEAVPEILRSFWQYPMQSPTIFVRTTGDAAALAAAIRSETRSLIPTLPTPKTRRLTEWVDESMAHPRFQAELLSLFATLALLLAACGIYGVLAYVVAQREREIGIRIALGAGRRNVLALVVGQGFKLALMGVAIGVGAALALTRVIRSLLFAVRPTDPATFGGVALALLGVALLACWIPARRAARIDPILALRHE